MRMHWLRTLIGRRPRRALPSRRRGRLQVERLEDRTLLTNHLTYYGGPLLAHVEATPVFYGAGWQSGPQDIYANEGGIIEYLLTITNGPYLDFLSQYSVTVGQAVADPLSSPPTYNQHLKSSTAYTIGRGTMGGLDNVPTNFTSGTVYDDGNSSHPYQIQDMLRSEIDNGHLTPDANRLFIVYVQPGELVNDGTGTSGPPNGGGFAGYHSYFTYKGNNVYFAVVAFPGGPNFDPSNVNLNAFQYITKTTSHELAEAITDPETNQGNTGTGWVDIAASKVQATSGGEIGDLVENQDLNPAPETEGGGYDYGTLDGYVVQYLFANVYTGGLYDATNVAILPYDGYGQSLGLGDVSTPPSYAGSDLYINQVLNPTVGQFDGLVATFADGQDANTDPTQYSVTIDWGDGTRSPGTVAYDATHQVFDVFGSHYYSYTTGNIIGQYHVGSVLGMAVAVSDTDGAAAGLDATVTLGQQTQAYPPVFNHPNVGPFTLFEGDFVQNVDLSAYNPYGGPAPSYSLAAGSPGTINNVGTYFWQTQAGDAGVHWITVVASVDPLDTATVSFEVIVLSHTPHIGALTASVNTITTSGNDPVNLSANNVTDAAGLSDIYNVVFYQDTNNNGQLDPNTDTFLGYGTYDVSTNSYSSPGVYLGGLTPGTATLFAQAENDEGVYSNVVQVTLKVLAASFPPPLVNLVSSVSQGGFDFYDQSGDISVVGYSTSSNSAYLARYDPTGYPIGSVSLNQIQDNAIADVKALPDGHFIVLWVHAYATVEAQEYNADGSSYGPTYQVASPGADEKVAISAPGEFAVVIGYGFYYGDGSVKYYRYSQGSLVNSKVLASSGESADVAMDPSGNAVVGWVSGAALAQRIGSDGSLLGGQITLSTYTQPPIGFNPSLNLSVAVDEQGRFVAAWGASTASGQGGVFARRFLADGTPVDSQEFRVNQSIANPGTDPLAVAFRAGKIVITAGTYGQAYTWDNTLIPFGGNFTVSAPYGSDIDYQGTSFAVGQDYYTSSIFTGLNATPPGFALLNVAPLSGALINIQKNLPAGTLIGQFQSAQSGTWTYRLVPGDGGDDNGSFQIVNGQLYTNGPFSVQAKAHYSIRVAATPASGVPVQEVFNLNQGNLAPVLAGASSPVLPAIPHDAANPPGVVVSSFADAGIRDEDLGAVKGIAVVGVTGPGTWEYSINGGGTWLALGSVSASSALLLRDTDQVRFVPDAGFLGTATISYSAWDQTSGAAGSQADLAAPGGTGGATAFSIANATATLAVAPTVASVPEGTTEAAGVPIATFIGTVTDTHPAAQQGIAVTQLDGTGVWQYSLDGGATWSNFGQVGLSAARLLHDNDRVRFLPSLYWNGYAHLGYYAWDGTSGTAGGLANLSGGTGGATSFSAASGVAILVVTPVNHAPQWTGTGTTLTAVVPGTANPAGDSVAAAFAPLFRDVDSGTSVGVAVASVTGSAQGTWQFSLDGGTTWNALSNPSVSAARLLSATDRMRFVPNAGVAGTVALQAYAWDGSAGSRGGTANLSGTGKTGGATAFSTSVLTASCLVNTAPVLAGTGPTLPSVNEDAGSSASVTVSTLLTGAGYSDPDPGALQGAAIVGAAGPGTWQYSLNGTTWLNLGRASASAALLLGGSASVRFLPAPHQFGTATLSYRAWDHTAGVVGRLFDTTVNGGASAISAAQGNATLAVNHVNHAPTWAGSGAALSPVLPNTTNPAGDTVAAIFSSSFQDVDPGTTVGVAVTALTGTADGTWQYSTDGGTTWTGLAAVSASAARLLSGSDRLRFVPNAGFAGKVTLQASAWDGTIGSDGGTFNLTGPGQTGGGSAFSAAPLTASCFVNTAPTLSTTGPTLPSMNENAGSSGAVKVTALLTGAGSADPDPGALPGVAVVGAAGPGSWQYSLNGTTWLALGAVSATLARLLPGTAMLRFAPLPYQSGAATLTYRAWDQTAGASGGLLPVTVDGGASSVSGAEASATLPVNRLNYAPVWIGTGAVFAPVPTNATNPPGDSVGAVFGKAANPATTIGVAVVALTGTSSGTWEYSTDSGTSWSAFGVVATAAAQLLLDADRIRFLPQAGFSGKVTLTAYAWDGATGTDGGTVDLAGPGKTGGATAFSTARVTATCVVNSAPILTTTGLTLPSIKEDTGPSAPATVTGLLTAAGYSDPDAGALQGLAVVAATGPGTWQVSLNGSTWLPLGAVSEASARLLPASGALRFLPALHQVGTATLAFRAWDQTAGGAGQLANVTPSGGGSPFSATEAGATLAVTPVNHAPTWSGNGPAFAPVLTNAANLPGNTVAQVFGAYFMDIDPNTAVGVAVTGLTGTTNGTWQVSTDGGTNWTAIGSVSTAAARLLSAGDRIRFVPTAGFSGTVTLQAYAWDGSTGNDGSTADLAGTGVTGAATAFSTTPITATLLVNTAPVLQ